MSCFLSIIAAIWSICRKMWEFLRCLGQQKVLFFLTLVSMSLCFFLLWDSPISCSHIVSYPPTSSKSWLSCQYFLTLSSCMQAQRFKWKIKLAFQGIFFLVWVSEVLGSNSGWSPNFVWLVQGHNKNKRPCCG